MESETTKNSESETTKSEETTPKESKNVNVNDALDDLEAIAKDFKKDEIKSDEEDAEKKTLASECKIMYKRARAQKIKIPPEWKMPYPSGFNRKMSIYKLRDHHKKLNTLFQNENLPDIIKQEAKKHQRKEVRKQLDEGVHPDDIELTTPTRVVEPARVKMDMIEQGLFNYSVAVTYISEKVGNSYFKQNNMDDEYDLTGWTENFASQEAQIKQTFGQLYEQQPEVCKFISNPLFQMATIWAGSGVATIARNDMKKNGSKEQKYVPQ